MKTLTVPVAPLTQKILLNRYRSAVVKPAPHDLLSRHLWYKGLDSTRKELIRHALTTSIELHVSDNLAKHMRPRLIPIGMHLYRVHKELLYNYVGARVDAKLEALGSVKAFMAKHGIGEDDFGQDTSYRLYKKWRDHFKEIRYTNGSSNVPNLCTGKTFIPLSFAKAVVLADRVVAIVQEKEFGTDLDMEEAIRTLVIYKYANLTTRELGEKLNRRFESIARSNRRAKAYLATNEQLQRWIEYCYLTTEVRATP